MADRADEWSGTEYGVQRPKPYEGVMRAIDLADAIEVADGLNASHPDRQGDWLPVSRRVVYRSWKPAREH